jgi:hypothetical protein
MLNAESIKPANANDQRHRHRATVQILNASLSTLNDLMLVARRIVPVVHALKRDHEAPVRSTERPLYAGTTMKNQRRRKSAAMKI